MISAAPPDLAPRTRAAWFTILLRMPRDMKHAGTRRRAATVTTNLANQLKQAARELGFTLANGIAYVRDSLCFPVAAGSFEDGMGA